MSVINLVFDNQLQQTPIEVPLAAPPAEDGDNTLQVNQVMLHGVCTPVVSICGIVFDFNKVTKMTLYDNERIPSLELCIDDSEKRLSSISNPKSDNEIRLQILPPFDDAYKKIDLTFYISDIDVRGAKVNISAIYKLPDIYISRLKSFGEIDTYNLFKTIASECLLGFASNCEENDSDKRFVYCNNISYEDLMNREIRMASNAENIFDYWVDVWNNINYVNIKQRFTEKDPEDEMELWCMATPGSGNVESANINQPVLTEAVITNHPLMAGQLHATKYNISNNIGKNKEKGTDRVYTIYKDGAIIDSLIEDGNIQNDIFTKYYYLGENIGEYEYLTAISFYDSFCDIINKNTIEVNLSFPMLGIMRGSHVKFLWYDNNFFQKQDIELLGGDMEDEVDQSEEMVDPDKLMINKQISGEYLVHKTILNYNKGVWRNTLILTRPEEEIKTYMP
jgi:hypothetical protein